MTPLALVTPSPMSTVHDAVVDGSVVVFNEIDRRLHVLNDSAAAVWRRLSTPTSIGTLTADVAAEFAVAPSVIRSDVERVIDRFVADGLVGDRPDSAHPPAPTCVVPDTPGGAPFAALDAIIRVHSSDPEVAEWIDRVVEPLRRGRRLGAPDQWIAVDDRGDGTWVVSSSLGTELTVGSRVGGVLRAISEINQLGVASTPDLAVFHAGAVSAAGKAIVLPGASNRGKSTLTTALVGAGFDYLTDEAAAIDQAGVVRPFPKSIALDPGSFGLFAHLAPPAVGPLAERITRREWHVDPATIGSVGVASEVAAIVCPHWRAGSSTRLARVRGTEALHTLLGEVFDARVGGGAVFSTLARVVERVPVYRLGYGDLDEAVAVIGRLSA